MNRIARLTLGCAVLALAAPATAAAAPPVPTTGAAGTITQTTATLNGTINPKGNRTFTFFQYGTSKLYGAQTPSIDRGSGTKAFRVADNIVGLSPFTVYHYRLVSQDGSRVIFGKDRTFRTDRQPLGLSLSANPGTVQANGSTVISGNISGTGNAGRQVVLQANPFPFSGFADFGNAQVADAAGNFSFPVLDVPVNTVFRVRLPDEPNLASPEIPVTVRIDVSASAPRKVTKGKKVTFKGRVSPANQGAQVEIQRKFRNVWVTVRRTRLTAQSTFKQKLRLSKGGKFRVLVTPGPAYVSDAKTIGRIRVVKKKRR